jgi:hypothetical protein
MNLSDISTSQFLASDDFKVDTILPAVEIERIEMQEVPTIGKKEKVKKAVIFFKGVAKGYVLNKNVGRAIAKKIGEVKNIDKTWVGASISLKVVGEVRRPDGTKGNAFRLHDAWPASSGASTNVDMNADKETT